MKELYKTSLALLTDLYQLTMSYGYFKNNMHERHAAFNLFYRKNPFNNTHTVVAGLESVIDYIENFQLSSSDLHYLGTLQGNDGKPLFSEDFFDYLSTMRFSCNLNAMEEGSFAFPHEPLLSIRGPLIQCQLLETPLLNIINFNTLIATKAHRICKAAEGPVLEFGLRRAQGIDGGLTASRAAYIGGCAATSNVLAGKLYDIPVKGTHAHSWVMSFDSELKSFQSYADAMPNNSILLVDTYNTISGIESAIKVGESLRQQGHDLAGIRLDSGDLAALSIEARKMLDASGFVDTKIVASNDLDEHTIEELKANGAKIDVWGVGTKLATSYDQPALGGVYKLGAIRKDSGHWEGRIKLSEDRIKTSNPGCQQVLRFCDNGKACFDIIYDTLRGFAIGWNGVLESVYGKLEYCPTRDDLDQMYECYEMLPLIFDKGKLVYKKPLLEEIRNKVRQTKFKCIEEYAVAIDTHMRWEKEKLSK